MTRCYHLNIRVWWREIFIQSDQRLPLKLEEWTKVMATEGYCSWFCTIYFGEDFLIKLTCLSIKVTNFQVLKTFLMRKHFDDSGIWYAILSTWSFCIWSINLKCLCKYVLSVLTILVLSSLVLSLDPQTSCNYFCFHLIWNELQIFRNLHIKASRVQILF